MNLNEKLYDVTAGVLENLTFLLQMPFEDDEPVADPDEPALAAMVEFSGPFAGGVFLRASLDLSPVVASNMLGLDFGEVATVEQQQDAVKELLNVVCGNLLPALAGPKAMFDVHAPENLDNDQAPETLGGSTSAASVQMELDEGWAEVVLFAPADALAEAAVA